MAVTAEVFQGPKIDVIPGCFITESRSAHKYYDDTRKGHQIIEYGISGLAIVHTGQVQPEPEHTISQAEYHGRISLKDMKILFGSMEPHLETSAHKHPPNLEELYCVIGKLHVYREGDGWTILE